MTNDFIHKTEFYALLAKHNARPSPEVEFWANNNWSNLESVVDKVCSLQHETKFKLGKNKTILCSVLGACLTAAVETRFKRRSEENAIIDSLQNLVEILQNENHLLRDENNLLRTALGDEYSKNLENADFPKKAEEKETPHIYQIYPQKELVLVKNCEEHCCPNTTPLVKTECNYIDENSDPQIITKEIPDTTTELSKLKGEYSHFPHESETEYVSRVSLGGGDQIKLTEQEASGYWGRGVFLTIRDKHNSWSLIQCSAHWAEGYNPLEKGNHLTLIGTPEQPMENIHKAACLQMIHDDSPMQLPVKPEIMIPLIQKPLELLKPIAIVLSSVEKLDRSLRNPSEPIGSTDRGFSPYPTPSQPPAPQSNSPAGDRNVYVLSEIAVEVTNYVKTPSSEKPEKSKQITSRQHLLLLDIKKGVPKQNPNLPGQPLPKKSQQITHLSSENLGSEPRNSLTIQPPPPSPSQHPGKEPKQSLPSQGNLDSPNHAHPALAQELEKIRIADNVAVYQCSDDIFVGRDEIEVEDPQQKIISNFESFDLQISPESKISGNLMEKKHDTHLITSFNQIKMPESTKELQQVSELLVLCRKHIPDFSIIARTLYSLLRKGKIWEWGDSHHEALKLLIFEATAHQTLGPTYPTDPFHMEWCFAFSGLSVQQPVVLRGPSPYATPPPDGVAEGASFGAVKNLTVNLDGNPDKPASVTGTAPPFCPKQSHFSAEIVPDWAKREKIKWASHTCYGWEANKCSKITAFCPAVPSINTPWIIPSY